MILKTTAFTTTLSDACKHPRPGDLWLAYVEFADHPGVGKVRPVVIIDVHEDAALALAAKVTTKSPSSATSDTRLFIECWEECGLRKPSYVRLDQRLQIMHDKLLQEEPLGVLPVELFDAVLKALV